MAGWMPVSCIPMHMVAWLSKLDAFLTLNDRDILTHAGHISHDAAQSKAEVEYDCYKALSTARPRPVDTDFEEAIKRLPQAPVAKKPKVGTKG